MTFDFLFNVLDLLGTFVFALSGAEAAKESELDLFGIIIVAFLTACGGGILRDLCLDITPPIGISYWPYLALTLVAVAAVALFHRQLVNIKYPVLMFDALGLALFTVAGTQKAIVLQQNYEVALLLGVLSAIGGGIIRDVLLGRIPMVLRKEVYGSAALLGSVLVIIFHFLELPLALGVWVGLVACFVLRYVSIKHRWNVPRI